MCGRSVVPHQQLAQRVLVDVTETRLDAVPRERDEKLPQRSGTAHPFHLDERA